MSRMIGKYKSSFKYAITCFLIYDFQMHLINPIEFLYILFLTLMGIWSRGKRPRWIRKNMKKKKRSSKGSSRKRVRNLLK